MLAETIDSFRSWIIYIIQLVGSACSTVTVVIGLNGRRCIYEYSRNGYIISPASSQLRTLLIDDYSTNSIRSHRYWYTLDLRSTAMMKSAAIITMERISIANIWATLRGTVATTNMDFIKHLQNNM